MTPQKDYIPFGYEWRTEVLKLRKADIVDMLRKALLDLKKVRTDERGKKP